MGAVKNLIAYCPRLSAEIPVNDKTPVTDGHIDVYADREHKNGKLRGRVAVQAKARTHRNKRVLRASEKSFAIDRDSLTFLRDNRGGIYFYVAVHPETREHRVFYASLGPFKLRRLVDSMRAEQQTLSVSLRLLSDDVARIEKILDLALETQKQNVSVGFDPVLFDKQSTFTVYSLDGIDLSRPAELSLDSSDFAVVLHTPGGLNLPVDWDLSIVPANYIAHQTQVAVSCGGVEYPNVIARQIEESGVELTLSASLRVELQNGGRSLSANLDIATQDALDEHLRAMEFFIAASRGDTVYLGDDALTPETIPANIDDVVEIVLKQYRQLAQLLESLGIPLWRVRPQEIDAEQTGTLRAMYLGIVEN